MRKILTTLGIAGAALLSACASSTGYAPAGYDSSYGFSERPIEQNRWQVSFSGNSLTDLDTVQTYLLYRAAELTTQQGFDYFVMVDRNVDEDTRFRSTGYGHASPFYYQVYHPRFGWRYYRDPFYDPFYNDFDMREVTRYRAMAEIVMGTGPKPADPKAYAARDVMMNLGPQIQRPEGY
ncbi:MAG: hypothetical protein CMK07_08035 [Ponticaulis sp.]|nr:hypothetical protein [Ponticaulis sp.]